MAQCGRTQSLCQRDLAPRRPVSALCLCASLTFSVPCATDRDVMEFGHRSLTSLCALLLMSMTSSLCGAQYSIREGPTSEGELSLYSVCDNQYATECFTCLINDDLHNLYYTRKKLN